MAGTISLLGRMIDCYVQFGKPTIEAFDGDDRVECDPNELACLLDDPSMQPVIYAWTEQQPYMLFF